MRTPRITVTDLRFAWWYRVWITLRLAWQGHFYFASYQQEVIGWSTIHAGIPPDFFVRDCTTSWFGLRRIWAPHPAPKGLTEYFHARWPGHFKGAFQWLNIRSLSHRCSYDPMLVDYSGQKRLFL